MRIHLATLGCRLNEAETAAWAREFYASGHCLVDSPAGADLVVVNTCAVTAEAARKSRRLLRRAVRGNPEAKLVVSGCLASLEPDTVASIDGIDAIVENADKPQLVQRALAVAESVGAPAWRRQAPASGLFERGRHRAFVKVQDGCRHRCSYCVVTRARGEERSRSVADIVDEVRGLTAAGVREVVLTGVHVGGYGADLGLDLPTLVRAILVDTDVHRLRLASIEPWDLGEAFFRLYEDPRVLPHLHLPLQSGSDRILKRMARRCRRDTFLEYVARARAAAPGFNVTTDIIAGFPGESEGDWRATLEVVEAVGFGHVHAFSFSARQGTAAARYPDHVPPNVRQARVRELIDIAAGHEQAFLAREATAGRPTEVLWERAATGTEPARGYTRNYLRATVSDGRLFANALTRFVPNAVADTGDALTGAAPIAEAPAAAVTVIDQRSASAASRADRTAASTAAGSVPLARV